MNKRGNDCIHKKTSQAITNLSDVELNDDIIAVLKLDLKYGLFIRSCM